MTSSTIITLYIAYKQYKFIRNTGSCQSRCWSIYGWRIYGSTGEMRDQLAPANLPLSARLKFGKVQLPLTLGLKAFAKGLNCGLEGPLGVVGQLLECCLSSPGHADLQPQEFLLAVPTVHCRHVIEVVQPVFPAPLSRERLRKYYGFSSHPADYANCSTWNTTADGCMRDLQPQELCAWHEEDTCAAHRILPITQHGQDGPPFASPFT